MKPSTKNALLGSCCMLALGCCLIVTGLQMGASYSDGVSIGGQEGIYMGNGVFSIGGENGIYVGNGVFSIGGAEGIYIGNGTVSIGGSDGLTLGSGSYTRNQVPIVDSASSISSNHSSGVALDGDFRVIEANISVGALIVTQSGEQFSVTSDASADNECFIESRGDTLYIGDGEAKGDETKSASIFINVPVGSNLEELSLFTDCGSIVVGDLDRKMEKVRLNTSLGDITWNGGVANLTAVSNLGDITITVPTNLQDISYDLSTSLGEVLVNTRAYGDNARYEHIEAPACTVYANSSLGDVSLNTET